MAEEVRLSLPAMPDALRVARVTAAGLASRLGFSYDEIEDLRLAIDEMGFALVGVRGRSGTVHLRYVVDGETLEAEGRYRAVNGAELGPAPLLGTTELSGRILDALVDDYGVRNDNGQLPAMWLRKRRAPLPR